MDLLWKLLISNAVIAGGLFILVLLIRRWIKNPALLHMLLLLVLIKLITPAVWQPQITLLSPSTGSSVSPVETVPVTNSTGMHPERNSNGNTELTAFNSLRKRMQATSKGSSPSTTTETVSNTSTAQATTEIPGSKLVWYLRLATAFTARGWTWSGLLTLIWVLGTLACCFIAALRIFRFQRLLKLAQPASDALQQRAGALGTLIGLKSVPQVVLLPGAISPLLWAFCCRARIILPERLLAELDEAERDTLLLHELAHYRRGDHWVRLIELVTTALYWWYPVAWWVRRKIRVTEEACCDAWVIQIEPDNRRAYAEVLVKATGFVSQAQRIPVATRMGSARVLEQRLTSIMCDRLQYTISRRGKFLLATIALLLLSLAPLPGTSQAETRVAEKPDQLPSVEEILNGYRNNLQRLLPLEMTYQMLIQENLNCINQDRQQLKQAELIATLKHTDLKTPDGNVVYNEQQFAYVVGDSLRRAEELRASLTPERIQSRQAGWISDRSYFWSDSKSFQRRWPNNISDVELDLTPRKLTQAALPFYFESINVLSVIPDASPKFRFWFGASSSFPNGQGRMTDDLGRGAAYQVVAPLGTTEDNWKENRDWHNLDYYMTQPADQYQIVGWSEFKGRRAVIIDGIFSDLNEQSGLRNRYRIWVDPERGYLPLRMEETDVNAQNQVIRDVHRYLEVEQIDQFSESYYPVKIRFQNYTYDAVGIQKQNERIRKENLDPKSLKPLPMVPGRSETWTVTSLTPHKPMQRDELAWEFPQGALFWDDPEGERFIVSQSQPEAIPYSSPLPLKPGTLAPPLEVKSWLDGKSQSLEALRGKVVLLLFIDGIQKTDFTQIPADMEKPLEQMRNFMKAFHAKYAEKGVVFLEIYSPETNIEKIREFHQFRGFTTPAAIDRTGQRGGKSNILYNSDQTDMGVFLIGRDGRIAMNQASLEGEQGEAYFRYVAHKLSIPFPGNETASEEESTQNMMRILEYILSEQVDKALAAEH